MNCSTLADPLVDLFMITYRLFCYKWSGKSLTDRFWGRYPFTDLFYFYCTSDKNNYKVEKLVHIWVLHNTAKQKLVHNENKIQVSAQAIRCYWFSIHIHVYIIIICIIYEEHFIKSICWWNINRLVLRPLLLLQYTL